MSEPIRHRLRFELTVSSPWPDALAEIAAALTSALTENTSADDRIEGLVVEVKARDPVCPHHAEEGEDEEE